MNSMYPPEIQDGWAQAVLLEMLTFDESFQ